MSGGKSFDNIDIASQALNIPIQGKENKANFVPLIKKAIALIDAVGDDAKVHYAESSKKYQTKKGDKPPEDYTYFLTKSHANLKKFVEDCGGTWRGLTFKTLNRFFCGFWQFTFPIYDFAADYVIIPSSRFHYFQRIFTLFRRSQHPCKS